MKLLKWLMKSCHFLRLIVLSRLLGENVTPTAASLIFLVGSTAYIDILFPVAPKFTLFLPDIFFRTCCWLLIYPKFFTPLCSLLLFKTPYSVVFFLAINSFTKALLLSMILVIFSICLFLTSSLKTFLFYASSNRWVVFLAVWVMLNFLFGEDGTNMFSSFLGVGMMLIILSVGCCLMILVALSVLILVYRALS